MMQHHEPECQAEIVVVVVAIFKVKITARAQMINIWLFLLYFLMIPHYKPECPVKKKSTAFRVKVTAKGQNVNVRPDDIF